MHAEMQFSGFDERDLGQKYNILEKVLGLAMAGDQGHGVACSPHSYIIEDDSTSEGFR